MRGYLRDFTLRMSNGGDLGDWDVRQVPGRSPELPRSPPGAAPELGRTANLTAAMTRGCSDEKMDVRKMCPVSFGEIRLHSGRTLDGLGGWMAEYALQSGVTKGVRTGPWLFGIRQGIIRDTNRSCV